MTAQTDTITSLPFAAQDLGVIKTTLDGINISADSVSSSLAKAFSGAVVSGKSFNETLLAVGASLARIAVGASIQPLAQGLTGLVGQAFSGVSNGVTPFAEGGIVAQPTYFGNGGSLGLMGERGAEAILPLSRGPDGRLGIAAQGQGGGGRAVNVTISTPDAESFRRSEAQVTGALARAVARGRRSL